MRKRFYIVYNNIVIILCIYIIITSGDENHLCGASLRKSHKISHRHACAHWAGKLTPIARPEKLP